MRRNVTIKDIAVELGLSHGTVSRALNESTRISTKTRELVSEAALRLGYIPNASARSIRGDGARWLGLIVPEIENQFYSSITVAFADYCRANDARMMFAVTKEDPEIERREVRAFLESRVSGVIVTLTGNAHPETLAMLGTVPAVKLIRRMNGLDRPVVAFAEADICRQATEHLLSLGHERLAYVGTDLSVSSARERVRGFQEALEARGIARRDSILELVAPPEEEGVKAVRRLLARTAPPTGLLVAGSQLTVGALRALRAAKVRIPNDMSIIAYGDAEWYGLHAPPISAISLPARTIVDQALDVLSKQSQSVRPNRLRDVDVAASLILRASTAAPPRKT